MKSEEITNSALFEMAHYSHATTGLPANIIIWVRTQPQALPHNKYRVKVTKNKESSVTFAVWDTKKQFDKTDVVKDQLSGREERLIKDFIKKYKSLIISHVDGKIDSTMLGMEIIKIRGME